MRSIASVLILLGFFTSVGLTAQPPGRQQARGTAGQFYGKIVDGNTNKPLERATIQLLGQKIDTATKEKTTQVLGIVITESNGDFTLYDLPMMGQFNLNVSAIGYQPITKEVYFIKPQRGNRNGQDMMSAMVKDLGNIKLEPSTNTLDAVTVTSTKSFFEMGVDRKIFNVDKNIVSQGQTATEVMKQIPGLNVDIDGNVTMRNAAPQLFVDGRPTTLTLEQIPADIIDKVELITNPSAKFDASGGNAGILNVVLKKNIKKGYNGGIRTGFDTRGRFNFGGDFNVRENKLNFFLSGNYRQNKSFNTIESVRENFLDTFSIVSQTGEGYNTGNFTYARGGVDYLINNRNTLTFTGSYVSGNFNNNNDQRIDSTIENTFASYSKLRSDGLNEFTNLGGQISFKHLFAKEGHNITADLNYSSSQNNNNTFLKRTTFLPDNDLKYDPFLQQTEGSGYNRYITIQTDYEKPINDNRKFETGARAAIRDFKNENIQSFYNDSAKSYIILPRISNNYTFKDYVYAAYANYSIKAKKWNYQFGLRGRKF